MLIRDGAIALLLFLLFLLGYSAIASLVVDVEQPLPPWWLSVLLGALMTLPLTVRRILPRTTLYVIAITYGFYVTSVPLEANSSTVAIFLAIYTVGVELPRHRALWPRAIVTAWMFALVFYGLTLQQGPEEPFGSWDRLTFSVFSVVLNVAFFAAAWVIGNLVRQSRANEKALADQADELARSRQLLTEQAVQAERVRIARELHDVVAHHVSVIGIQAGAARTSVSRNPEKAGQALAQVESSSREAIVELQQLLGFLREGPEDAEFVGQDGNTRGPQPQLADLEPLLASVEDVGLAVQLNIDGDQPALPDAVELSAYRIIQEALTNALKHADGATQAWVHVSCDDTYLQLVIRDNGTAAARQPGLGQRGLIGMQERAMLHDGNLTASPHPGGGFLVQASLRIEPLHHRRS